MALKTQQGGTVTVDCWIPHVRHPDTNLLMPVKIKMVADDLLGDLPTPMRRMNRLVYALPGGKEYCAI